MGEKNSSSVDEEKNLGNTSEDRKTEQGMGMWLEEIEKACNAALLDIYDLSIANAPIPAKECREIADCIGHRVGQIRESVAALRAWQPIETAPKGKDALLYQANGKYSIADWGRYEKYNGGAFTHWMPLPDPPEVKD